MNNKIILFDIDYTLFDTDHFKKTELRSHSLYEEVIDVLKKLSKIATLGIFSEGELAFQTNKLIRTDILKYFHKNYTYIVEKKDLNLKSILNNHKNEKLFFVDDKLTVLFNAKVLAPSIFTIWVKRGMYANVQKPIKNFKPDAIIDNLSQVYDIVKNN